MDLMLPPGLKAIIRDRYLAGVSDAVSKFDLNSADEDALTGALGSNISMPGPRMFSDGVRRYEYEVSYKKIRGRGPKAPERFLGADGIFQIEVRDEEGVRQKGLPFQSKKNWRGADRNLNAQAIQMVQTAGDGLVVDYTRKSYDAFKAADVIHAGGNRRKIHASTESNDLGQLMANDFLDCDIGVEGLFFDPVTENWNRRAALEVRKAPEHVVTTYVKQITD